MTRVTGGNPDLLNDDRRVFRVNLRLTPTDNRRFTIQTNYVDQRVRNAIVNFPSLTPDIEAAFPERFLRDADGQLLEIDARPVNYAETNRRTLRYGVSWSKSLRSSPPDLTREERQQLRELFRARFRANREEEARREQRAAERQRRRNQQSTDQNAENPTADQNNPSTGNNQTQDQTQGQPQQRQNGQSPRAGGGPRAGGAGRGGPGAGRGRPRGGRGGGRFGSRLQISAFHTIVLQDEILISEGSVPLDLLNGDAVSANGGSARHQIELRAGYSMRGLGARVSANWQSATTIDSTTGDDLRFNDLGTVNLRFFLDPGQRPRLLLKYPFLLRSRLTLDVNNVFNARQEVVNTSGETPVNFQPELIDPLGRTIRLRFRKQFF